MGQFIDLTGKVFSRLTVIRRVESYIQPDGKPLINYLCLCKCGNETIVTGKNLKNGNTKSCGCYNIEKTSERSFIDLSGQKFGMLTVLERAEDYLDEKSQNRITRFLCLCDCGNKKIIRSIHLKNGSIVSCGCRSESNIATETKRFFAENYGAKIEYRIVKNPKTNRWLYFDIYIPDNIFIEIHGLQHYEGNHFWLCTDSDFEYQEYKDNIKKEYAKENGIFIEIDLRNFENSEQVINHILSVIGVSNNE
jgi:hypothetical protein